MIPLNPAWCIRCRNPQAYGLNGPCEYHRGENGESVAYVGPQVYSPTEGVMQVIGNLYVNDQMTYRCIGFDPRHGFIMRGEVYPYGEVCVSTQAIGRTFTEKVFGSPL